MTKNKGKPSQQVADERKELEVTDERSPRAIHRLDRSRSDEKGGKGELPTRLQPRETTESKRQRKAQKH